MALTPRFFLILAIAIVLALASLWQPEAHVMSLSLTALLLGGAVLDWTLIPRGALQIRRQCPQIMFQGRLHQVTLTVRNLTLQRLRCRLRDSPPSAFCAERQPLVLFLPAQSEAARTLPLRSYQRGEFAFGPVFYRILGPLGLVERQEVVPLDQTVFVFPDAAMGGEGEFAASLGSRHLAGRRPIAIRGEGREFESLREYQRDDHFRDIDWKASAKRGKLIARQYQVERDQRVLILVDLGRLMGQRIGPFRKLDYAVNAAVRLAQTALREGDLVGLLLFSQDIAFYLPPRKGSAQFASLVRALVSAQPRRVEPDYRTVFHYARRRNHRRTLMVCFTDLLDLTASQNLVEGIQPLIPRHLPLTVTISDSDLLHTLERAPQTASEVYEHAAAQEIWNDYERTLRSLDARGVPTLNVSAQKLSVATLNRYFELKRSARW